jgi:peptide/nickel transport system ATP-binding protein
MPPDPERPGKVVSTETVIDRSTIDNTVCFNHHTGAWEKDTDPVSTPAGGL